MTYNGNMKKIHKFLSTLLLVAGVCAVCIGCAGVIDLIGDTKDTEQSVESVLSGSSTAEHTSPGNSSESIGSSNSSGSNTSEPVSSEVSSETSASGEAESTEVAEPYVSPYADFFKAYPDCVAWFEIPDTGVSYPVMWTPGDETYYLYRNYDGSDNQNGSLLLDTDSSLSPLTTNLIIHGHNMRSGAMFGNLTDYEDRTYYEQHKEMLLFTNECERKYEVIAVFRSQVYKKTDTVFKFYKFFQANTEEEFKDFYDNIKRLSIYDTGVTAEFGDHFITLSTCVSHVETGRFVVVAKEITDTESQE